MRLFENELRAIEGLFSHSGLGIEGLEKGGLGGVYENFTGQVQGTRTFSNSPVIAMAQPTLTSLVPTNIENQLALLFGNLPWRSHGAILGPHPDFKHLKINEYENHYAVSMFVDIKGSTRLSAKYPLPQVRQAKDAILSLAIYICNFFGGHIQRLQGDGIFVYFVGRDVHRNDAVISALNASSVLTQFISTDLANSFEAVGIEPLRIRIGIDYGDNDKVLWSHYGIPNCSELTTTSLHTDLAAKLQVEAPSNGVMIGDNIRENLDLPGEYLLHPTQYDAQLCKYIDVKEPYIFNGPPRYRYWQFDWKRYLNTFDFIRKDSNGRDLILMPPPYKLVCEYTYQGIRKKYPQNLFSVPKGAKFHFTLLNQNGTAYVKSQNDSINWSVINTGNEAKAKNELQHNLEGEFDNGYKAEANAGYLGHHHIICKVTRPGSDNLVLKHYVFVQ